MANASDRGGELFRLDDFRGARRRATRPQPAPAAIAAPAGTPRTRRDSAPDYAAAYAHLSALARRYAGAEAAAIVRQLEDSHNCIKNGFGDHARRDLDTAYDRLRRRCGGHALDLPANPAMTLDVMYRGIKALLRGEAPDGFDRFYSRIKLPLADATMTRLGVAQGAQEIVAPAPKPVSETLMPQDDLDRDRKMFEGRRPAPPGAPVSARPLATIHRLRPQMA